MRHLSLSPSSPEYPTASELHRARECVAPWALGLPEGEWTTEWAEFGKRCHVGAEMLAHGQGIIEALARALPEPPHKQTDAIVAAVEAMAPIIERDVLECKQGADGVWLVEQGIKWRPGVLEDEAALCERQPGERLRGWFSGTADLVYVRHDNLLVVVDWKFGPREHITGEPAKDSCQGFFLATAFAALLGIRGSSAGVVVARFERRMVSEDGIEVDAYDITQGELDAFAEQLRGLARRIDSQIDALPRQTKACHHCKAKSHCPAKQADRDELRQQASERIGRLLEGLPETPEDAAFLVQLADAAKAIEGDCKEKVKAFAMGNRAPIPVGLGIEYRAVPNDRDKVLQTEEALDLIEREAGKAAIVVQRKASKESIADAVRATAGKGSSRPDMSKDKAEMEVLEKLRAAGAIVPKGGGFTMRVFRTRDDKDKGKPVPGYGTFDE